MENREVSQQLEEMRQQIAILKGKLETQKIVNEKQLRNSMTKHMSKIDRRMLVTIILGCLSLAYCTWFFTTRMHLSHAFTFATAAMVSVCLAITIHKHYSFRRIDISHGNIMDVIERLTKIKKHYGEWWKIGLPLVLVWYAWLMYEVLATYNFEPYIMGFSLGSAFGIVIGLIAGFKFNQKIVKETEEILDQIKELQQML